MPINFNYDLNKLVIELSQIEHLFMYKLKFMKNWQGIPLRNGIGSSDADGLELTKSLDGAEKKRFFKSCIDTDIMKKLTYIPKMLDDLKKYLNTDIGLVRILKIPAGQNVAKHCDGDIFDLENGQIYRLHLPIISHPNVNFIINEKNYYMEPGKLYYANVFYPHEIRNNSDIDRIHMVIDVLATPEIKKLLKGNY
jgi:hypothetical protein